VTVTDALPDTAPTLAEMRANPVDTPVTAPLALTVAVVGEDEFQLNPMPDSVFPPASRAVAVNDAVCPTCTVDPGASTVTVATSAGDVLSRPQATSTKTRVGTARWRMR
jgi:hypothetical protein